VVEDDEGTIRGAAAAAAAISTLVNVVNASKSIVSICRGQEQSSQGFGDGRRWQDGPFSL
jgi:hypothetical protein